MSWPHQKLELLASTEPYSFVGGPFGSKLTSRDYVDEGIPVIRGSNLNNGRYLDMGDFVFVSESKVREDLTSNLAKPGDLVFTQRGTLGQVAIIPEDGISDRYVVSQSQMKLTVDSSKADTLFLYYYFSSRDAVEKIINCVSSSGVPHINLTVLRNFSVPVPPVETQQAIASVLSAYDDLIENNRRRIQLLEQAARLLYKEWFVHLRFPGHEHVRIVDGVPEGWANTLLPDVIAINPKTPVEKGKEVRYVPMSALSESGMTVDMADFELRKDHTSVKFKKDDVLLARITPCLENGKTGLAYFLQENEVACGSTEFIVLRGKNASPFFTYCLARSYPFRENAIKSMIGSSGRQRVQVSCFDEYKVPLPPKHLLAMFDEIVVSSFEQIKVLMAQNGRLAKARDLLLPRLMNGEVSF